jgi:hypothetical protein
MKILLLYLLLVNAVILVELSKLTTLDKRVISVSETKDLPATLSTLLLKELHLQSYQN